MRAQIIDNISRRMGTFLSSSIKQAEEVKIAVAFMSQRGLDMIGDALDHCLQSGGYFEMLVGLDMHVTDPQALQDIYDLSRRSSNVTVFCHASPRSDVIYHPKLYLLKAERQVSIIIGSSNLTQGGLKRNIEANLAIQAEIHDQMVSDAYDTYNQLKFHQHRVIPDQEFLDLYVRLCNQERETRQSDRGGVSKRLAQAFQEKVSTMQHPAPSLRDLVGWASVVYASLPQGEFTNQDVYVHEDQFRREYPDNQNVRAKIRQQLQVLRDLGLIEHLDHARWRKLP